MSTIRDAVAPPPPPPPTALSEPDLTRRWVDGPPLVSVLCATYQHVDLIGDALSGFLAQRTEFPFEVVVRDDASTDGTADVVAEWAARYPGVIRAVLEPVNTWSAVAGGASVHPLLASRARGSFIAWCEGDDYWTDPGKLAAQVALLQDRPDAVASHHDQITSSAGRIMAEHLPDELRRDQGSSELLLGKALPLRTLLHRNDPRLEAGMERFRGRIWNGDRFRTVRLGLLGGSAYAASVGPAVYRRHAGGVSTLLATDPQERAVVKSRSYFWIAMHLAANERLPEASAHLDRALGYLIAEGLSAGVDVRLRTGLRLTRAGIVAAVRRRARPLRRFLPGRSPR